MNTTIIKSLMSCVIAFLTVRFNIEFTTLPLTCSDLRSTILGHMGLLHDLRFTLLYVVVSQRFDKHLYLAWCLNAHICNTFAPKQVVLRER